MASMPQGPPNTAPPIMGPSPPADFTPSIPMGPQFVRVLICEKCRAELPTSIQPGDRCPKCNVVLAFVQMENGMFRDKQGQVTSTPPLVRYTGIGALGSVVIGVIVVLLRAFRGRG